MPLLIDLFCGKGGWTNAAQAAGYDCIGFDIADHGYRGNRLIRSPLPVDPQILADMNPSLVCASPPCEEFARRHLPWINLHGPIDERLLRWSISLASFLDCPVIVECSRFAARHVPDARFCGPYALWGDVPALLPEVSGGKTRKSGKNPADRAMIPAELADWIIATCKNNQADRA